MSFPGHLTAPGCLNTLTAPGGDCDGNCKNCPPREGCKCINLGVNRLNRIVDTITDFTGLGKCRSCQWWDRKNQSSGAGGGYGHPPASGDHYNASLAASGYVQGGGYGSGQPSQGYGGHAPSHDSQPVTNAPSYQSEFLSHSSASSGRLRSICSAVADCSCGLKTSLGPPTTSLNLSLVGHPKGTTVREDMLHNSITLRGNNYRLTRACNPLISNRDMWIFTRPTPNTCILPLPTKVGNLISYVRDSRLKTLGIV
jgi:hypothetical protein